MGLGRRGRFSNAAHTTADYNRAAWYVIVVVVVVVVLVLVVVVVVLVLTSSDMI